MDAYIGGPRLAFDNQSVDFGQVPFNKEVKATFQVKNVGDQKLAIKKANAVAGMVVGVYFLGVFVYLFTNAVIPLTATGGWRGIGDVIAVGFYLLGVVPLAGIALLEVSALRRGKLGLSNLKLHATFVAMFLVVAHVAMIFGMLSPQVLYGPSGSMPGM